MALTKKRHPAGEASPQPIMQQPAPMPKGEPITPELSNYIFDILEKQYRNYTWNDGKAYALATLDSFLFAAGFVIYDNLSTNAIAAAMLFGAILFLSISALSCCLHSVPTLRSGRAGPDDNLRALSCITGFSTWQAYRTALQELNPDRMFEMTCRQIYGMAHNNARSHRLLGRAARCTMVGLCLLLLAVTTARYGKVLLSIGGWDRSPAGPTNTKTGGLHEP